VSAETVGLAGTLALRLFRTTSTNYISLTINKGLIMFIENSFLLIIFIAGLAGILGLAGFLAEHFDWE
jgi:hypothetical protein